MITDTVLKGETDFQITKRLIAEEIVHTTEGYAPEVDAKHAEVLPILHNTDVILLAFNGWAIRLNANGTWAFEDTLGG